MRLTLALGVTLLALTACGGGNGDALKQARDSCVSLPTAKDSTLADGGHTLVISGLNTARGYWTMQCILDAIDTPKRIESQIDTTNSVMGRQKEEANGYTYEWSYHPDNGVNMTISDGGK